VSGRVTRKVSKRGWGTSEVEDEFIIARRVLEIPQQLTLPVWMPERPRWTHRYTNMALRELSPARGAACCWI
jgi:hypothetical protein